MSIFGRLELTAGAQILALYLLIAVCLVVTRAKKAPPKRGDQFREETPQKTYGTVVGRRAMPQINSSALS